MRYETMGKAAKYGSFYYKNLYVVFRSDYMFWLRMAHFYYGFVIERTPLSFSERQGITKYLKLPYGWRLKFLGNPL